MTVLPSLPTIDLLQMSIDALPDPIFAKDLEHRWIACNRAFCGLLGHSREALLGRDDLAFLPPEQARVFWEADDRVVASNAPATNEEQLTDANGTTRTVWTRKFPLRGEDGTVIGLVGIITDVTELQRRQIEVAQLLAQLDEKAAIIETQTALLEEVAVPVIEVWDHILLLPLVGAIDSRRAAAVMDNVLSAISRSRAQVVIVDITGVPVVDTSTAGNLIRTMQAAQLLGCESLLVGISPEIAQTLVQLGIDFSHITTHASLQSGLKYALKRLNYTLK